MPVAKGWSSKNWLKSDLQANKRGAEHDLTFGDVERRTGRKYARYYDGIDLTHHEVQSTGMHDFRDSWNYYVVLPNYRGAKAYELNLHYLLLDNLTKTIEEGG